MSLKYIYSFSGITLLLVFVTLFSPSDETKQDFSEVAKIAMRDVGHHLLLAHSDSTSLVLPVIETDSKTYELSFQNALAIHPDSLVTIIETAFLKSDLPKYYRVEVIQCSNGEVAYSYEKKDDINNSIIPCGGRMLPEDCYTIKIKFTKLNDASANSPLIFASLAGALVLLFIGFKTKKRSEGLTPNDKPSASIGSFQFYPDQNKLVKAASEIQLSKKECELLEIFIENINVVVKRDELVKRVWEDQGVFVGRSLDTYISKLRKKFKDDPTVKITNIHGVGYKLEVNS
ncbi:winged helix-turn-helix domain-containing protein [Winogradskyella sp. A3E31]|uniref:winged helix-turn-helix domain-containing protein n=1 Tax=Winogradskyella sp. A3E31 TaxID=3349637 RepID=UPI00398AB65B